MAEIFGSFDENGRPNSARQRSWLAGQFAGKSVEQEVSGRLSEASVRTTIGREVEAKVGPAVQAGFASSETYRTAAENAAVTAVAAEAAKGPFASKRMVETARKNAALLGVFQRRLNMGLAVKITCMGDSTTYGQDTVSADKVPAPSDTLPDGSKHSFTRSPAPWPSVLADRLNTVYTGAVTVENRGYSGDTAGTGFNRWRTSSASNLTVLMYGINDDNVGAADLAGFMTNLEELIMREVNDYGAAVVIATPVKQLWDAVNRPRIEAYRHALEHLAKSYGAPLIDTEPFLAGYTSATHSDGWHLNTYGNNIIGSRMAAAFVGMQGPGLPFLVSHGFKLATRDTLDNLVLAENAAREFVSSPYTPADGAGFANGIDVRLAADAGPGRATYGFFTTAHDLVAVPNYVVPANQTLTCALDFGVDQGDNVNDVAIGVTQSRTERAAPSFTHTAGASVVGVSGHATGVNTIRIANPGWHTLTFTGTGTTALPARLRTVEFIDHTVLRLAQAAGI